MELVFAESALHVCTGVHAWACVTLKINLVATAWMIFPAEEMIKANFIKCCRRRIGRDMSAHPDAWSLCAMHKHCSVPSNEGANSTLDGFVAGECRLFLRGNGVDV